MELSWGAGLGALELLWQPRTRAELAGPQDAWVFDTMSASAWVVGAIGAVLLPTLVRVLEGRVTWAAALLRVVQGTTLLVLGLAWGLVGVPALRAEPGTTVVAATGVSCRQQIEHGSRHRAWHPVELLHEAHDSS